MIFEAIVSLLFGVVELVFSALGNKAAPGWFTGLAGDLDSLVATGASMGVWVPWGVLGSGIAAVVVCLGISMVVRVVRMLLSLFTGGGGSAA